MTPQPLAMSPYYQEVVQGIRELHKLTLAGKDESPEADAVRDAIDGPWEALSEPEQRRVRGLSEDLYSISDLPIEPQQAMNPQAQARLNDAYEARDEGDWDRALELLRRWGKHLSPALVSFVRGTIWLNMGDRETAVLFFEHAAGLTADLTPENGNYLAIFLHVLEMVDTPRAQAESEKILQNSDKYAPRAVARAANVAFKAVLSDPWGEAKRLIPVLEETLERIEADDETGVDRSSYAMTAMMLGYCHEFLGDNQAALGCYSRGLRLAPNNNVLLVARGILLYGTSPRAISDFELAIRNEAPIVWPYFFMAHHYLMNGRYEDCREMCDSALRMPASDAVKSELAEWRAISQAELGFPAEMVKAAFESSIRLDPLNDRAQRNLTAFEEALRPPQAKRWEIRSEAAVRASGMAARRYERAAA